MSQSGIGNSAYRPIGRKSVIRRLIASRVTAPVVRRVSTLEAAQCDTCGDLLTFVISAPWRYRIRDEDHVWEISRCTNTRCDRSFFATGEPYFRLAVITNKKHYSDLELLAPRNEIPGTPAPVSKLGGEPIWGSVEPLADAEFLALVGPEVSAPRSLLPSQHLIVVLIDNELAYVLSD